ncbi:MAG: hypothetical protein ABIG55_04235 [Candidatus Omnitrophota bacterium]
MEMKDLLRIEKLKKSDRAKLVFIVVGLVILAIVLASNRNGGKKAPAKENAKQYAASGPDVRTPDEIKKKKNTRIADIQELVPRSGRSDPFVPPRSRPRKIGFYSSSFRLEGVTTSPDGKVMAIINDEIVAVGGKIGSAEVVSIAKEEVVIREGEKEYKLKLWSDRSL